MKVLAINSSPNKDKGNTALILEPFLEGMREEGAEVEIYYTRDLKIKPCLADHICQLKTPGNCIQDDDMKWLLPKIGEADVWVWASPVYDDGVTGPMKMLMDRMVPGASPFLEFREGRLRHVPLGKGKPKKMVVVSNCGFPEMETFDPLLTHITAFCANANAELAGTIIRPAGPVFKKMLEKGAPVKDILQATKDAGSQFVRDGKMSEETLNIISRPIISRDMFMQMANQSAQQMLQNNR
jgi:multimeric flavodoxin WrbA